MTRDEILAMKPGKTLDVLVAEKVMGWIDLWTDGRNFMMYPPSEQNLGVGYAERGFVPDYSTDISAAMEVVENLRKQNMFTQINIESNHVDVYIYQEISGHVVRCIEWEKDQAVPEAICKAALLAKLGGETDERD